MTKTDPETVDPAPDLSSTTSRSSETASPQDTWRTSTARERARPKYIATTVSGALLIIAGVIYLVLSMAYSDRKIIIGIPEYIGGPMALLGASLGVFLFFLGFTSYNRARTVYREEQDRVARGEVVRALDDIAGPDDLLGLMRANRKQMDAYDSLARSQAEISHRASLAAMTVGLFLIGVGVAVAVLADSASTKYAAAIVTAVGAATGGYISRTFLTVQRHATEQMNYYFQQPLVQSYLLSAERLISRMPTGSRGSQLELVVKAVLMQASPMQPLDDQQALAPTQKTRFPRRSRPSLDSAHQDSETSTTGPQRHA